MNNCRPCNNGFKIAKFEYESLIADYENYIKLYHCSAETLFEKLFAEKRCPNLTIIDPPYELNIFGGGKTSLKSLQKVNTGLNAIKSGFDHNFIFGKIQSLCKLHKKPLQIYCFCSNKQISKLLSWGENNGYVTTLLVWYKTNAVPMCNGNWLPDLEYLVHIREKGATFVGGKSIKSKLFSSPYETSKWGHPTEKPMLLIKKLLEISSVERDLILDCFSGSGTTADVCKRLNRNFIGSEIDFKYHQKSIERLNQTFF